MKARKSNETDAQYIARLEQQNASLKQHNGQLSTWAGRVNESVTRLATEGSLVFQAMAEKAGVRGHPSVTQAVRLFDMLAHPQWQKESPPAVEWPTDWTFEGSGDQWSGDADMQLNAPIATAIEELEHLKFAAPKQMQRIDGVMELLHKALEAKRDDVKAAVGFKPRVCSPPPPGHYRDMSADQLRDLVETMAYMALDLAQDMHFANHMLRRDLRASTYRRVCADLYALSWLDTKDADPDVRFQVKVFGGEEM